jgi:hypothetical protein
MIWRPAYTANGWYPHLSWPWLAHGFGECWLTNLLTGETEQREPGARCQAAGWLDAITLVYYTGEFPATIWSYDVRAGVATTIDVAMVNRVVARGGSWATGLGEGGIVRLNGQEIARGVGWRVDVDGEVLACTANDGLHVWVSGIEDPVTHPKTTLVDPRVSGLYVGYGYNGPARLVSLDDDTDTDVTVTPWRKESAPICLDGWIWTTTEIPDGTSAALGRPMGETDCLILRVPSAVGLDVQRVGDEWVVATYGSQGQLVVQSVRVDAPRVPVTVPPAEVQPIAPFAVHMWAACYKDPALKAPNNVIFAPEPLSAPITGPAIVGPFRKTLDFAVGWTLAIEDIEEARTTALACKAMKNLPVYAYLGSYVPEARIDGIDYPLLQAYRVPGRETADAILVQLRADLARCAYASVGLAVDLTDRTLPGVGGWPEADRVAFLVGIADLCREIQPVGVFAWAWDRKAPQAGISASPVLTEQWRQFVEAIPAPVVPPPVTPDPPEEPSMPAPHYHEHDVLAYCETIRACYREAGREPDDMYPVWIARCMYDYTTSALQGWGLSWAASCAKHLRECRDGLGLAPVVPPF